MNIRRALLVAFISAVIVLLLAPVAAVAGSSMADDGCDMTPMFPDTTAATCCESGNCLAVCCSVPDTTTDKVIASNLPVPSKNFVISFYKANESVEITVLFDKPLKQDSCQTSSFHPCGEYHCRNSLDSEESFHN